MWLIRCRMWMPSSRKLYACTTLPLFCFDGPWKTSWWTATLSSPKYVFHHSMQLLCSCSHIGRGGLWQRVYCPSVTSSYAYSSSVFLSSQAHDWVRSTVGSTTATVVCQQARSVSRQQTRLLPITIYALSRLHTLTVSIIC